MIAFDYDVDVPHRRNQPLMYGYIPDDNGLRGRCFTLMTLISALHNLSRSVGCAILTTADGRLVIFFVGGEVLLYLIFKVLRNDISYWIRIEGGSAILLAFFERTLAKVVLDFTGCLHFRHPYEVGGVAFTTGLVWAQVSPFVALQFYEGSNEEEKDALTLFLVGSLGLWLLLNVMFFCTINLKYLNTFIGT